MEDALTYWESEAPEMDVTMEEIDHFDARGMRRVYGRGDSFGRYRSFNMDIWKTRDERLLMRCWSRCREIDWRSFEIRGADLAEIPERGKSSGFQESWVPHATRLAYENWIEDEY
jgi:hypothetical protein